MSISIFLLLSVLDTQPHGQWWPGWSDKDYSWHEKILILFISNCEFYKITFAHNVTMFSVHFALIWKVWTNPFFVSHNPSMCPYNQFCWQLLYAGLLLWKNYSLKNLNWRLCTYRTHKCFVDTWHQANEIFHSVHKTEFDGSSEGTKYHLWRKYFQTKLYWQLQTELMKCLVRWHFGSSFLCATAGSKLSLETLASL